MKNIIIVGCGSHAAELVDYVEYINEQAIIDKFTILGFIDNTQAYYDYYNFNYAFLGSIDTHVIVSDAFYLMGIGNLEIRTKVLIALKVKGALFTGLIHPTALISKSSQIGEGTVISHNVSIGPKAKIGAFNVINSRCTIGHDAVVGDNNFISPQVVLGGYTRIGSGNLLGTNSCLIPKVEIGDYNKIMAGMTVTNNVSDRETVFYRFKEKLMVRKEIIEIFKPTI